LALLVAACAPLPPAGEGYPPQPPRTAPLPGEAPTRIYSSRELAAYPRTAEAVSGPAVLNLIQQARTELAAGRPDQAIAALELALDIEPRNPFVWQQLADTHLKRHLPEQAEHVAQRANSFAHGNPYVEIENWRVIAQARQQRGDAAGAQQARDRLNELQSQLEN
jgi:tetratricopeptide (TPR) repeat protein